MLILLTYKKERKSISIFQHNVFLLCFTNKLIFHYVSIFFTEVKNIIVMPVSSSSIYSTSRDSRYVTLQNVDAARHAGMYQCAAYNTHGVSYTAAQLRVLGTSPAFFHSCDHVVKDCHNIQLLVFCVCFYYKTCLRSLYVTDVFHCVFS